MLRNDLDKVRMLAELTRKREKEKLKQAQVIKDIVDSFIFPAYGKLRLSAFRQSSRGTRLLRSHQGTHVLDVDRREDRAERIPSRCRFQGRSNSLNPGTRLTNSMISILCLTTQ